MSKKKQSFSAVLNSIVKAGKDSYKLAKANVPKTRDVATVPAGLGLITVGAGVKLIGDLLTDGGLATMNAGGRIISTSSNKRAKEYGKNVVENTKPRGITTTILQS